MDLNLLPESERPRSSVPRIGLSLENARRSEAAERIRWAGANGFRGVELAATGESWSFHAPAVDTEERFALSQAAGNAISIALLAPTQATFDLSLVSPSAAIRRASVTEIWSVCRLAGSLIADADTPPATVVVRTGVAPLGVSREREAAALSECVTTLDRMAGEHHAHIALLNVDFFHDLNRFTLALTQLPLKHTGVALDIGAALDRGISVDEIAEFIRTSGNFIRYIRVPDSVLPEFGVIAAALTEASYGGMFCITPSDSYDEENRALRVREWWSDAFSAARGAEIERDDKGE